MLATLALVVVVLTGLYLVSLGVVALFAPALASRFLLGFAGSAAAHYAELLVRLLVGGAFLVRSPQLLFPGVFSAAGWILIGTTAALFLIPWRWHRSFAQRSVPQALRYLGLIGVASLVFGGGVLVAAWRGVGG